MNVRIALAQHGELLATWFVVCGLFAFVVGLLDIYLFVAGAMVFIFGIMALAADCADYMNGIYK